jgi:hypothetical protein
MASFIPWAFIELLSSLMQQNKTDRSAKLSAENYKIKIDSGRINIDYFRKATPAGIACGACNNVQKQHD